jgi:integrase/recombinase XerC
MALKSLAHYAAEVIRIGGNFAAGLILPRIPPRRLPKILDRKDAEALITAPLRLTDPSVRHVGHYRDAAFLELLYGSGLRVSEACSLDLDQVKIKPDPKGGEYLAIRVIGKRKKERLVVVKGPATEVLKEYIRQRDYIPGARDNPALFLNWFGERLGRGGVRIMVKKWARRALGHERAHPHLFRHTYATDLVAALGEKLRGAQELLGHDDPVTTAKYAQIDELRLLETARKHPRAQELTHAQLLHRTGEVLRAGAALACDAARLLWRSIKRRI